MKYSALRDDRFTAARSLPLFIFVLSCASLDVDFHAGLQLGNIITLVGCLTAIALAPLSAHWLGRPRLTTADGIYLSYLALVAASGFWAPAPLETAVQFVLLFTIWLATVFLGQEPIGALVRYVIYLAFAFALLAFALAIVAPGIAYQWSPLRGYTNELRGIFDHQLRFGLYVGMALAFLILAKLNGELHLIFRRSYTFYLVLPVLAVALFLAYARLYSFFVFLSLFLVLILPGPRWARGLLLLAIAGLLLLLLQDQSGFFAGLDDAGIDATLTGRTGIWEKTIPVADRTPIWGHGFPSFNSSIFDWMWARYRPAHPHNSYLQAYFETGYVGLSLTILLATVQFLTAMRDAGLDRRYSYMLFIVALTVVGSLTGANYAAKPSSLFVYMMLAFAIESRRGIAARAGGRLRPVAPPISLQRAAL